MKFKLGRRFASSDKDSVSSPPVSASSPSLPLTPASCPPVPVRGFGQDHGRVEGIPQPLGNGSHRSKLNVRQDQHKAKRRPSSASSHRSFSSSFAMQQQMPPLPSSPSFPLAIAKQRPKSSDGRMRSSSTPGRFKSKSPKPGATVIPVPSRDSPRSRISAQGSLEQESSFEESRKRGSLRSSLESGGGATVSSSSGTRLRRIGGEWTVHTGEEELIIAVDLGTTYSGASYCLLRPGKKPRIEDVKGYPGQSTSNNKVPSLVLYNARGVPSLYGAEAAEGSPAAARVLEEGGAVARWWKLSLKPTHIELGRIRNDEDTKGHPILDPLPFGIRAEEIAAHFLSYIVSCVGTQIVSRLPNGAALLESLAERTRYVITVPNGWELPQQQMLREACITAGLVSRESANLVVFVTEAEASINFCAQSDSSSNWLEQEGQHLIVCDAGGGTIDISSYRVESTSPNLSLVETSPSECLLAGATTIDRRARSLIQKRLAGTEWDNKEDLDDLQARFSTTIKEAFSDPIEEYHLALASRNVNVEALGIRKGKLVFSGKQVAALFEPCIRQTERSLRDRVNALGQNCITIAMVGGFSESNYFRNELQERLGDLVILCKPDEVTSKAVASGAVAWLMEGVVEKRVAKLHYGIRCSTLYRPDETSHIARFDQRFVGKDGRTRLPGSFGVIMSRGHMGHQDDEHVERFQLAWRTDQSLIKDIGLFVYRGEEAEPPEFVDEPGFEELARFRVDMNVFRGLLPTQVTPQGSSYHADIQLAMRLNGPELSAQVLYQSGGRCFRGPVTVILSQIH